MRRLEARLVLGAVALAAAAQAGAALWTAWDLAWRSWAWRGQSHAAASLRELGPVYYQSLLDARRALPVTETVYFVDRQDEAVGATYFALYYLAPRHLVRVGSTRENSEWWLSRQVPRGVDRLLLVGNPGTPLELVSVAEFGARPRGR